MKLRQLPIRLVAGAYVLHQGLQKWRADEGMGETLQAMSVDAYPQVKEMPADQFRKTLAVSEMAIGGALLAPFVPAVLAGSALTGFAAGLVGLYARTPGMRQEGSIWPTQEGTALSKDTWLLGIGLALVIDGLTSGRD